MVEEGTLSLHGLPARPFKARLAQSAQPGDISIAVDDFIEWQVQLLTCLECKVSGSYAADRLA